MSCQDNSVNNKQSSSNSKPNSILVDYVKTPLDRAQEAKEKTENQNKALKEFDKEASD